MIWAIDHTATIPLRDQIITCVRRAITTCQLNVGDQLPPAVELAEALSVDRNTVLAAYRQLRSDGVLEFRRGRGVRVAKTTSPQSTVVEAAHQLIKVGNAHGLDQDQLIQLIRELT
jgi:GntR family transcriptional regulator